MRKFAAVAMGLGVVGLAALPRATAGPGAASQFLYVHDNGNPNEVWGYRVETTGQITPLANSPFATANQDFNRTGTCGTMAYSARLKLLFTTGSTGVSVFRVAADGQLSLVEGSPFGGTPRLGVAVVEKGKNTYLYSSEPDAAQIHIDQVNADGTLNDAPTDAVVGPVGGINATKNVIYFAGLNGKLIACKILKDGTLRAINGIPDLGTTAIQNVSLDPTGKFLYIPDLQASRILGFKVNNKKGVTPLKNFPLTPPGLSAPNGLDALPQSGKPGVLLALARSGGAMVQGRGVRGNGSTAPQDVLAFRRDKKGKLTPFGSTTSSSLTQLAGGAIDSTGSLVALVDDKLKLVFTYTIDPTTGALQVKDQESADLGSGDVNSVLFVKP